MDFKASIITFGCLLLISISSSLDINQKLTMTLYYESLCPFCHNFIVNDVYPVWRKINGEKYINAEFVPYGNAKTQMNPDGTFNITCQHGEDECKLNVLHNCALKYISRLNTQISFIYCTLISKYPTKAGPDCAKRLRVDFNPIRTCANGDEGNYLHYFAGNKTNSLSPAKQGVPWIIFNNTYNADEMTEARQDFLRFICKKITGQRPSQCNNYIFS